jgi:SAM-dependent methyltransferase
MARPLVDFGVSAGDYARHRPGFPDVFFGHVRRYGIGLAGQWVVDIGTGTGALARGFAQRGCRAVGVDPSPEMLHEAVALTPAAGLRADYVRGRAEATGLAAGRFDLLCAGQCWHWFDRVAAAAETWRILRPGGHVLIAYFSYLSEPGTLGGVTEELVLRHNPAWPLAGSDGRASWLIPDLTHQGFEHIDTFEFDMPIAFTHASWRGRLRACNGVMTLPPEQLAAFDADLAALLAEGYPEPLLVPHRIYGIVARKSATAGA